MGAGEALAGRDPPVRTELLHESERTRVTRLFVPGRTVIRKEPLGPDAERRLQHEAAMLARLRGVAGVAQLAGSPRYAGSIVLADPGSASLTSQAKPLAVHDLTGLAVAGRSGGGDAPAGGDASGHHAGEHRGLRRRGPVPGGLRA
jgi:hypothetical protein